MAVTIHIDGGARGNPGPGAAGVLIADARGQPLFEAGYYLGHTTNNQAEYRALLLALEAAARLKRREIAIFCDSELLVRQLTGEYRVRAKELILLHEQAQRKLLKFRWHIRHVPREENTRADEMVNLALNRRADVVTIDAADSACAAPKGEPPSARQGGSPTEEPSPRGPDFVVVARTVKPPNATVCPSPCASGREFLFSERSPEGMCLVALRSVLHTVLGLQHAGFEPDNPPPPAVVRCGRAGCGAEWELRCRATAR